MHDVWDNNATPPIAGALVNILTEDSKLDVRS